MKKKNYNKNLGSPAEGSLSRHLIDDVSADPGARGRSPLRRRQGRQHRGRGRRVNKVKQGCIFRPFFSPWSSYFIGRR